MAEYLGEGQSQLRGDRPDSPPVDFRTRHTVPKASERKSRTGATGGDNLARFLGDFKGGMASLDNAIDRLLQHQPASGTANPAENRQAATRTEEKTTTVSRSPAREIATAQQTITKAPARQPQDRSRGVPQFPVGTLKTDSAMRPAKGNDVEALMKVAKSIKAGRLPFVPKETRRRAQELLNSISSNRKSKPAAWTPETPQRTVASIPPSTAFPERKDRILSEREAQSLESVIPRFRDEGADSVASGPKIIDAGESTERMDATTVVYRDNSSHVASPEAPSAKAPPSRKADNGLLGNAPPPTPEHRSPAISDTGGGGGNSARGGLRSSTDGGTSGTEEPVKITGELTIPGLDGWIAKIEGIVDNG